MGRGASYAARRSSIHFRGRWRLSAWVTVEYRTGMSQGFAAHSKQLRLAVLLSGGGTTLQNIADAIARGELSAKVAVVISSKAEAFGVQRARNLGVPVHVVSRK